MRRRGPFRPLWERNRARADRSVPEAVRPVMVSTPNGIESGMDDVDGRRLSWAEAFALYTRERVLAMLFLGF